MTNTLTLPTSARIEGGHRVRIAGWSPAADYMAVTVAGEYPIRWETDRSGQTWGVLTFDIEVPEHSEPSALVAGVAVASRTIPAHRSTETIRFRDWGLEGVRLNSPYLTFQP